MASRGNRQIESFAKAKKHIYAVAGDSVKTFYCDCEFTRRVVDHASCGYVPMKADKRSRRTEIEHVVPAHAFGQSFNAWRNGDPRCRGKEGRSFKGRNCARKVSGDFRRMEADLFNLRPVIGEVNARRKHYSMAMIPGESRSFGACDIEIEDRRVEPRPAVRGDVARTYLYMDWAYPGRGIVSKKQRALFEAWSAEDPVDELEREWARVTCLTRAQE